MSRSWKAKSKKAQKKHAQRIKDRQDDMKLTTTVSAPSQKEGGSDVSMPVNELGKPGVPVTDVFMGIPPAIGASSEAGGRFPWQGNSATQSFWVDAAG
jgi:hypothetical protein